MCEAYQEKSRFLFLAMYRMRKYVWLRKTTSRLAFSATFLSHISECCAGMNLKAAVHLKLDTGFHRMGIDCCGSTADCVEQLLSLFRFEYRNNRDVYPSGIRCRQQSKRELAFTELQYQRFQSCIGRCRNEESIRASVIYATVRQRYIIQIAYGHGACRCLYLWSCLSPGAALDTIAGGACLESENRPAAGYCSRRRVGYGHAFIAKQPVRIAVLAAGFADGYRRCIAQSPQKLCFHTWQAGTLIGKVCMDMFYGGCDRYRSSAGRGNMRF